MTRGAVSRLVGSALLVAGLAASVRSASAEDTAPAPGLPHVDAISGGVTPPPPPAEPRPPPAEPPAEPPSTIATDLLDPPAAETVPEGPPASKQGTVFAIKVILGLIALLVLAYLGGHPSTLRVLERLGIRGVMTAGFPFVALGLIASQPSVGILTDDVIPQLRPVLQFGLGWLGFIIGAQLDIRVLDRVPRGTAYLSLVEALGPFVLTTVGCGAVMVSFGLSLDDPAVWRDLILLGTAAAMTAPRRFRGFANRSWREGRSADVLLGQLDEFVGVIGLLFLTAYFRGNDGSSWALPGTAWVFVSIGLGVTIGVLIFAMIRVPTSNAEFLAVVLGAVAFASGLAGYLRLSPIVICFLAGVLVTNFPNEQRASVFKILARLERPVHLVFLMLAGALWAVGDWRGWALVVPFVILRVSGKYLGILATRTAFGALMPAEFLHGRQLVVPMSSLSIALVVSIERFRDPGLPWVITAVIGSAIIMELLVQVTAPRREAPRDLAPDALAPPDASLDGRAEPPPRDDGAHE